MAHQSCSGQVPRMWWTEGLSRSCGCRQAGTVLTADLGRGSVFGEVLGKLPSAQGASAPRRGCAMCPGGGTYWDCGVHGTRPGSTVSGPGEDTSQKCTFKDSLIITIVNSCIFVLHF